MKKFSKGCLVTALTLFIFGCVFCGVFGALGGFRQLNSEGSRSKYFSWGANRIRWSFFGFDIFDSDEFDEEWFGETSGSPNLASTGTTTKTDYQASEIKGIDIELGGANLIIQESEDDYIRIENDSNIETLKYGMKNGIFKLYNGKTYFHWWSPKGSIYLYLPKGMDLSSIDMEIGAGKVQSIGLEADEIDLEVGAGKVEIESLQGNDIKIAIGAGGTEIDSVVSRELSIEVSAGNITVQNMDVEDLQLESSAGSTDIEGSVERNVEIECSAGTVDIELQGTEEDYNYEVECSAGTVRIGDNKYSGLGTERSVNNGSSRRFEVDCSAGTINVDFVE